MLSFKLAGGLRHGALDLSRCKWECLGNFFFSKINNMQ